MEAFAFTFARANVSGLDEQRAFIAYVGHRCHFSTSAFNAEAASFATAPKRPATASASSRQARHSYAAPDSSYTASSAQSSPYESMDGYPNVSSTKAYSSRPEAKRSANGDVEKPPVCECVHGLLFHEFSLVPCARHLCYLTPLLLLFCRGGRVPLDLLPLRPARSRLSGMSLLKHLVWDHPHRFSCNGDVCQTRCQNGRQCQ